MAEKRLSSSNVDRYNKRQQPPEMLLKALGNKSDNSGGLIVYDLTAGFGRDSAILASSPHVARVVMVERDPIVGVLLQDAVRRLKLLHNADAALHDNTDVLHSFKQLKLSSSSSANVVTKDLASKLYFQSGDGANIIQSDEVLSVHGSPSVAYLDPMFPPRTKKAAVKKNMQILHDLLQSNVEEDSIMGLSSLARLDSERSLLEAALGAVEKRVIVKRPIHAPPLGFGDGDNGSTSSDEEKATLVKPSFDIRGSTNRWDVYLI